MNFTRGEWALIIAGLGTVAERMEGSDQEEVLDLLQKCIDGYRQAGNIEETQP